MYFIDVKERRIDRIREGVVVNLPITADLSLFTIDKAVNEVNKVLNQVAAENKKYGRKPLIFDFILNFSGEPADFGALTELIVAIFSKWNTQGKTKRRDSEYRLDAPRELSKFMYYPSGWLKDMVNYECRADRFVLCIHTANNEFCYHMFDEANLDKEETLPYAK